MGRNTETEVSRREFVKASTVATLAAVAASSVSGLYGYVPKANAESPAGLSSGVVAN